MTELERLRRLVAYLEAANARAFDSAFGIGVGVGALVGGFPSPWALGVGCAGMAWTIQSLIRTHYLIKRLKEQ